MVMMPSYHSGILPIALLSKLPCMACDIDLIVISLPVSMMYVMGLAIPAAAMVCVPSQGSHSRVQYIVMV